MAKADPKKMRIMERLTADVARFGLDLIDVETVREHEKKILRLIIDKNGGVGIDDCVAVSEMADPVISGELAITDHDVFEVQSAGLDRNLSTTADLRRHIGADVDVKFFQAMDGRKIMEGVLTDVSEDAVTLRREDGSEQIVLRKDAATIRRGIRF